MKSRIFILEDHPIMGRGYRTLINGEMDISPKTIATHRGRIKTKLAIESTPELVRRAVLWIETRKPDASELAR